MCRKSDANPLPQEGHFARLVQIGMGNAVLREQQQGALQDAAGFDPVGARVAAGAQQHQVGGGGNSFAFGRVENLAVQRKPDDGAGDPLRQAGGAHHGVTQPVPGSFAVAAVVADPRKQLLLEGGVLHLGGVAGQDALGQTGMLGGAVRPCPDVYAAGLCGCDDAGKQRLGNGSTIVGGAVGLAMRNLFEQGVWRYAILPGQGNDDLARVADPGAAGVALVAGGNAQVFGGTAQADEKLAIIRIDHGQAPAGIGADGDVIAANGK